MSWRRNPNSRFARQMAQDAVRNKAIHEANRIADEKQALEDSATDKPTPEKDQSDD